MQQHPLVANNVIFLMRWCKANTLQAIASWIIAKHEYWTDVKEADNQIILHPELFLFKLIKLPLADLGLPNGMSLLLNNDNNFLNLFIVFNRNCIILLKLMKEILLP